MLWASVLLVLIQFVPGCIDVGHDAEVGCLVEEDEPGCPEEAGADFAPDRPRRPRNDLTPTAADAGVVERDAAAPAATKGVAAADAGLDAGTVPEADAASGDAGGS
jgi:hypothetical protein